MARLRYNGLATGSAGSLADLTLSGSHNNSTTTLTFNAALTYNNGTAVPTITGSDYFMLSILDAGGRVAEIVKVTAYTTAGTTATVVRGQEGTSGVSHASGAKVAHSPTAADFPTRYVEATRTSGDLALGSTAVTAVDTGLDLTLNASVGDIIVYGISGVSSSAAVTVGLDVYTMVGGSQVNPFGFGLTASLSGANGVSGWLCPSNSTVPISGEIRRTLVSGDISSGTVTLRLYRAAGSSTSRTIFAGTAIGLRVWAENRGQG